MPRTARSRRPVAVVVAALVVLAACDPGPSSGDDDATASAPAGTEGRSGTTLPPTSGPVADGPLERCPDGDDIDDPAASQRPDTAVSVDDDDVDGVGDPTVPDLGDPRLDVVHTDLQLVVADDGGFSAAAAALEVEVTESTDEIALDLVGLDVTAVAVDGAAVEAQRVGPKLVVPLGGELDTGAEVEVLVCYRGDPTPVPSDAVYGAPVGWTAADDGSFVLSEPEGARSWFPSNEHPTDKSTFAFTVTVEEGLVALANGVLVAGPMACTGDLEVDGDEAVTGRSAAGGTCGEEGAGRSDGVGDGTGRSATSTWRWEMDAPMAAFLATVLVGDYQRAVLPAVDGVPVEIWYGADDRRPPGDLERSSDVVAFLVELLGPFPFASASNAVMPGEPDDPFLSGVAFEAQSLSIYAPGTAVEEIVVHETAHQWFGDSVTLERWAEDLWLVEGFATYAEWLWVEEVVGAEAYDEVVARAERLVDGETGAIGDLPPDGLFEPLAYQGGALVYHALRAEVGDEAFVEILRTFVERYEHANASTDDLVAVASEVAGEDLEPFFSAWLDTPQRPPAPR